MVRYFAISRPFSTVASTFHVYPSFSVHPLLSFAIQLHVRGIYLVDKVGQNLSRHGLGVQRDCISQSNTLSYCVIYRENGKSNWMDIAISQSIMLWRTITIIYLTQSISPRLDDYPRRRCSVATDLVNIQPINTSSQLRSKLNFGSAHCAVGPLLVGSVGELILSVTANWDINN